MLPFGYTVTKYDPDDLLGSTAARGGCSTVTTTRLAQARGSLANPMYAHEHHPLLVAVLPDDDGVVRSRWRLQNMLTGNLVRLRPVEPEDADALYRWHNDEEVMRWLQSYFHESLAAIRKRIADRKENSHDKITFCIETLEEQGKLIGIIALRDADPINARAEVDIYIGEKEYWGGGYGTDALRTVCRYGFDTLRLHSIELGVVEANERAIKSYQKVGFQIDGRLRQSFYRDGEWYDSLLMCVLRDELK